MPYEPSLLAPIMSTCSIFLKLTLDPNGAVDGEAVAYGFPGQIEVIGFDWGLGRPSAANIERAHHKSSEREATADDKQKMIDTGIDPKTGKALTSKERFDLIRAMQSFKLLRVGAVAVSNSSQVKLKEFSFTKRFDIASTPIYNALNHQTLIKEACFTVLQGAAPFEVTMGGVLRTVSHAPHFVIKLKEGKVRSLSLALEADGNAKVLVDSVVFGYRSVEVTYHPPQRAGVMSFSYQGPASS